MAKVKGFTNPETAKKYRLTSENWNRIVSIAGGWSGPIKDIPPAAVLQYISKGRKDIVPIEAGTLKKGKEGGTEVVQPDGEPAPTK